MKAGRDRGWEEAFGKEGRRKLKGGFPGVSLQEQEEEEPRRSRNLFARPQPSGHCRISLKWFL